MKIIFSSNVSWSIYNFRLSLLKKLKSKGYKIYTLANKDLYSKKLSENGFKHFNIEFDNHSKNPIKDLKIIYNYYKVYKKIKPDIVLHNAIKPNIYGTIACGMLNIPVINNISGLGTVFINKNLYSTIAKILYKFSQLFAKIVFFQNKYDMNLFINNNLINKEKAKLIPGSGVDTKKFSQKKINNNRYFSFLFSGRVVKEKGVLEYISASEMIKKKHSKVKFYILGELSKNKSVGVSKKVIRKWSNENGNYYLGKTDDVKKILSKVDSVVLPSYREGLPKSLIEASSMGIPIITTRTPGCIDVILDKKSGLLCEVKNSKDLASKMTKMLSLSFLKRKELGKNGRNFILKNFDEKLVINKYLEAIKSII